MCCIFAAGCAIEVDCLTGCRAPIKSPLGSIDLLSIMSLGSQLEPSPFLDGLALKMYNELVLHPRSWPGRNTDVNHLTCCRALLGVRHFPINSLSTVSPCLKLRPSFSWSAWSIAYCPESSGKEGCTQESFRGYMVNNANRGAPEYSQSHRRAVIGQEGLGLG